VTFVPVPTPSLFSAKGTRLEWCRYYLKSQKRSQTTSQSARTSVHRMRHCLLVNAADRFHPASYNWRWPDCAARLDCRRLRRHTPCVIPSRHTCWRVAATSVRSKNCLVMLRCQRPRSIRRSTRSVCLRRTRARILALDNHRMVLRGLLRLTTLCYHRTDGSVGSRRANERT